MHNFQDTYAPFTDEVTQQNREKNLISAALYTANST
jgi:hypothetical protein